MEQQWEPGAEILWGIALLATPAVSAGTLDILAIAPTTGLLSKEMNFAVRGPFALAFLARQGIAVRQRPSTGIMLEGASVGDLAEPSMLAISCGR